MSGLYSLPPGSPLSLSPSPSNSPTCTSVTAITQGTMLKLANFVRLMKIQIEYYFSLLNDYNYYKNQNL